MIRPRRSALYLPGSNQRAIEKAKSLDCDVILFDLEDAVAPERKTVAREQVRIALATRNQHNDFGTKELVIRINSASTAWYDDDLKAVVEAHPHAVLLPKVESAAHVQRLVDDFEKAGGANDVRFWCMIETPRGVLQCDSIANSHQKLECLVMGTSDLTQDMRALHTSLRLPLITALGLCLLAARAHGLTILDGVALDLANEEGFVAACTQGRELGFDGKTLIHPKQIAPCNAAFSPSDTEVTRAECVVSAYAEARAAGRGVVVFNGQLVEELHVREAQRILAVRDALGSRASTSSSETR